VGGGGGCGESSVIPSSCHWRWAATTKRTGWLGTGFPWLRYSAQKRPCAKACSSARENRGFCRRAIARITSSATDRSPPPGEARGLRLRWRRRWWSRLLSLLEEEEEDGERERRRL